MQYASRAAFPPGEAREDWAIIRAMAARIGINLGFDTLDELRDDLIEAVPHFAARDEIAGARWAKFGGRAKLNAAAISGALDGFHMTCAISRASETMGQCMMALAEDSKLDAAE